MKMRQLLMRYAAFYCFIANYDNSNFQIFTDVPPSS